LCTVKAYPSFSGICIFFFQADGQHEREYRTAESDPGGRDIADRYTSTESTNVDLIRIGRIIRKLFPRIKTTYPRNKQTGKQETAYQYIELRGEEQAEAATLTIENITNYIPKHCAVLLHTNDKVTFIVPTQFLCNGNILSNKVTIHNSKWNLSVRERGH
jgi:hypothetical protein